MKKDGLEEAFIEAKHKGMHKKKAYIKLVINCIVPFDVQKLTPPKNE